jgi:creatinine amidohydrolase
MRLDELNWMDVESYLQGDDRLIFVLGACEQHGYLSLLTDVKIPLALADAASQQTGVLVAPPVNYGISPYFMAYPGTISLRLTTFVDLVEDLVRSAYRHGFHRFLFLNGHGGNDSARSRLYELSNQLPEMSLAWFSWWVSHSVELIAQKYELKPSHANWLEAFTFTQVAEMPEGEKTPPSVRGLLNAEEARAVYGDGSFGGYYQVDKAIMDELFAACLADVLQILGNLA